MSTKRFEGRSLVITFAAVVFMFILAAPTDVGAAAKKTLSFNQTVSVKVTGAQKYTSTKKKIATVTKKGKVTSKKKAGTCYIKIKTKKGKTQKVKITVKAPALGNTAYNLNQGDREYLKWKYIPAKTKKITYTYSSSNQAAVAVDGNGEIYAQAPGESAVITAIMNVKYKDGSKGSYTARCTVTVKGSANNNNNGSSQGGGDSGGSDTVYTNDYLRRVTFGNTGYNSTTSSETELEFTGGQNASSVLGQKAFEKTEGMNIFNRPGGSDAVEVDGKWYYFLADTWNNRVLMKIFYSAPTGKDQQAVDFEPDLVLGQSSFDEASTGYGLNQMNWPIDVDAYYNDATGIFRLYVADTNNNRVLVYNEIPSQNGQAAVGSINWYGSDRTNNSNAISWPWNVATTEGSGSSEGKLIITSTESGKVHFWNTLPTEFDDTYKSSTEACDFTLKFGSGSTPRTIVTNGTSLIIGDENVNYIDDEGKTHKGAGMYIYNKFPSGADSRPDLVIASNDYNQGEDRKERSMTGYSAGVYLEGGGLLLSHNCSLYIWKDGKIKSATDYADIYFNNINAPMSALRGQFDDFGASDAYTKDYFINGGAVGSVTNVGGTALVVGSNGNRILGYTADDLKSLKVSTPGTGIGKPSFYYGSTGEDTDRFDEVQISSDYQFFNPTTATDGTHLVVCDDLQNHLYLYKNLPSDSGAVPDVTYCFTIPPTDACFTEDGKLVVVTRTSNQRSYIMVWNSFPEDGRKPDTLILGKAGTVTLEQTLSVWADKDYFYISTNGKTYLYRDIPAESEAPLYTIDHYAENICSNDKYIVVSGLGSDQNNNSEACAYIYEKSKLPEGADTALLGTVNRVKGYEDTALRNLMATDKVIIDKSNRLYVGDIQCSRVLIWNDLKDALVDDETTKLSKAAPDTVLGGEKETEDNESSGYSEFDLLKAAGYPETGDSNNCRPVRATNSDTMFMPRDLCFDGRNLWVGEFKFSGRLLRFEGK